MFACGGNAMMRVRALRTAGGLHRPAHRRRGARTLRSPAQSGPSGGEARRRHGAPRRRHDAVRAVVEARAVRYGYGTAELAGMHPAAFRREALSLIGGVAGGRLRHGTRHRRVRTPAAGGISGALAEDPGASPRREHRRRGRRPLRLVVRRRELAGGAGVREKPTARRLRCSADSGGSSA